MTSIIKLRFFICLLNARLSSALGILGVTLFCYNLVGLFGLFSLVGLASLV